ncbi:MAG: ABC transporter ATP-binding protein, partial [Vallitaleaceae bacterium]|nr:ABC transporter ATP-binding protein [Vallitaleaceae bacterium]
MDVLKFGFQYWKRRLLSAIFVQFLSFTAILCDLMLPLLSAILVDYVLMKSEIAPKGIFRFLLNGTFGEVHTIQLFFAVGAFYLGLVLLRILLIYIKSIWFQHLGLQFETELRSDTFHKLMELDSQSVSRYHTGELLQTIHSDTIMFKEMFCRMIPGVIDSFFLLVMSISLLAFINVHFLWIPVFLAPLLVFTFYRFRRRAKENFARIRESNADLNLKVRENIEAVRLVRSFTNEEMEKQQFDGKNNTLRDAHLRQINLHSQFEAIIGGYKQFAFITTIVISSLLIMKGFMSVGYLVTCSAYMMRIMDHITHINGTMVQMQQQIVSGEKMLSFLQAQSKIPDGKSHKETAKNPHIRLEKVGLTLDGQRILEDISIDLPYGKKLGIVGETGSGKSVLLKLLVRIYDVTEGRIEVNGKK